MANIKSKDSRDYQQWVELCNQIRNTTADIIKETPEDKIQRLAYFKNDFVAFAKYYFERYMKAEFGWFHVDAAKQIGKDKDIFCVLEWPREHAKSVFSQVMIPLWLYARGELSGMITVSSNEDKAINLLSDLQAEFVANQRWIHDFGELAKVGDWTEGAFSTVDNIGFWTYGRGQSPRGARKASNRPNYCVIDDIDDKIIVKSIERVKHTLDWVIEDVFGCLAIAGGRVIIAGNRIHKQSILAHLVGDVEPDDPKRKGIYHSKVYAFEHEKTHTKADPTHKTSRPAWKEFHTREALLSKFDKMGYRSSRREYFHEHHEEGHLFKPHWLHYIKPLDYKKYTSIIVYCDPSFKDTKTADFKGIVAIGTTKEGKIDILKVWLRQASTSAMVKVFYDIYEVYGNDARYYMETNMLQDLLLDEFHTEGLARGYQMPIRRDDRKKPDKFTRVENLTPLYERSIVRMSEDLKQSPDGQEFVNQLLGFPFGHDDGPDALEGAIFKIQKTSRSSRSTARTGTYSRGNSKYS
jgi:predicted phage terminase large subunit-like protein